MTDVIYKGGRPYILYEKVNSIIIFDPNNDTIELTLIFQQGGQKKLVLKKVE